MEHAARRRRTQAEMGSVGVEHLIVSPSADLVYLTGYDAMNMERPTLLVLPQAGDPFFLVPQLEADKTRAAAPGIEVRGWRDEEDPWRALRARIGDAAGVVAVSDVMRAGFVLAIQEAFPRARVRSAGALIGGLRQYKDADEVEALREAGRRTDAVFEHLRTETFAGRTEVAVADLIGRHLRAQGLAWKWSYICSVAGGDHSASPHHVLSERPLRGGDAVCMDFGGKYREYVSDLTRTVHIGPPDEEFARVYGVVREAQERAVRAVRPGVPAEEIDRAARGVIAGAGYGDYFTHRTGHGLGLEVHEPPYIVAGNTAPVRPGMVFSVEPGIYLPGRFGVRIEDIVVVTRDGCERLNQAHRDLCVVA
ncbi:MAG TPA: Xaa-Pro peptidase family protein [bacterium]|nr:Xaa-Pro peptidase family protein [bacterium]